MSTYSFSYSIPYLFLFICFIYYYISEQNSDGENNNKIFYKVLVTFVFFFGFRGFVYTDWSNYYKLFEDIPTLWERSFLSLFKTDFYEEFSTDIASDKSGMEVGFIYYTSIIKSFFPNYFVWVLISTIIDFAILNAFFKRYSKLYVLSFLFFLAFGGLIFEINLMRNIKAVLLFFISIRYIEKQSLIKYSLINLLGFLFHSSSIIFFPLYFILNKNITVKFFWFIFVLGNVIFLFQVHYLEPVMTFFADMVGGRIALLTRVYFESDQTSQPFGITLGYIERTFTFVLFLSYRTKLIEQNDYNKIFINIYLLYYITCIYFTEIFVVVDRMSLLFIVSYWILYPNVISLIKNGKLRNLIVAIILFYCLIKIGMSNSNILSLYQNIIFGITNVDQKYIELTNNIDIIFNK